MGGALRFRTQACSGKRKIEFDYNLTSLKMLYSELNTPKPNFIYT
jgi:hypothetical protein